MNARTQKLVGLIRIKLQEVAQQNVTDQELYDIMNYVQDDILLRTDCLEAQGTISLVDGTESYDISQYGTLKIKSLVPSWDEALVPVAPSSWLEAHQAENDYPLYFMIFARKLFLAPTPTDSTLTIAYYAVQTEHLNDIDENTAPEIPEYCDKALIEGVVAQYIPDRLPLYEQQIDLLTAKSAQKHTMPKTLAGDW